MTKRKTAHWLEDKSWHRIRDEMLLSPAWKAASHLQRSMVFALLTELGRHSGKDNGHLKFTNRYLQQFGFSRDAIKPNLAALSALGFISYKAGRPGLRGYGKARRGRLTFMPIIDADGKEVEPPTDEWARFTTTKEAKIAVRDARKRAESRKPVQKSDHYHSGPEIGPLSTVAQPPVGLQVIENVEPKCRKSDHYLHLGNQSPSSAATVERAEARPRGVRVVRADARGIRIVELPPARWQREFAA
jgi:hypothetical protein